MRGGTARAAAVSLVVALLAVACRSESGRRADTAERPAVPEADLAGVESATRSRIEDARSRIAALLAETGASSAELAAAFGVLGHLYLAYDFYRPAEACYRSAAEVAPQDFRWPYYSGLAFQSSGDLPRAEAELTRAVELGGEDLAALVRLGNVLLELGKAGAATGCFERARRIVPQEAAVLYGLGRAAALEGDAGAAIEQLERVLALQPRATAVHYQLGQLYRGAGDLERAKGHLAQAGDRPPSFPDPLAEEVARAKVTTAFDVVRELARNPDPDAWENTLGFAIVQFGDLDGAVAEFRRLLDERQAPLGAAERAHVFFVVGALEARRGRDDRALESYRQALALDPGLHAARVQLASSLARTGRPAEALVEVSRVLAEEPERGSALLRRAAILSELGRFEEAAGDLARLAELAPRDAEARLRLASTLERLGRAETAMAQYRAALELAMKPEDRALAYFRLAELERRAGDLESALGDYRRTIALDGAFGAARFGEASALLLLGRHTEARDRLEEGLRSLPEDLPIAEALARHLAACPDRAVRDGNRAVELARDLVARRPTPENRETLAMAIAQAGDYRAAAELQALLLEEAERKPGDQGEGRLRAHLALYRRGSPCCAPGS